jgi:putative DNA primase/helicase
MEAARECHGVAGREYIECLSENFEMVRSAVDATIDIFVQEYVPKGSSGQVKRVGRRFGLVAAGGELAIYFRIIPWEKGSAKSGVGKCFMDWLEHRGDDQDIEEKNILSKIQLFFEMHGDSRFSPWYNESETKTYNRAGFKKSEGDKTEYYVLEEVFKNEICQGSDWKRAAKLLVEKKYLKPSTDGKSTRTESLPGIGRVRCYRFEKIPAGKE